MAHPLDKTRLLCEVGGVQSRNERNLLAIELFMATFFQIHPARQAAQSATPPLITGSGLILTADHRRGKVSYEPMKCFDLHCCQPWWSVDCAAVVVDNRRIRGGTQKRMAWDCPKKVRFFDGQTVHLFSSKQKDGRIMSCHCFSCVDI